MEGPQRPKTTQGQEVAGPTAPDAAALDAQLEQAGVTIREINLTVDNVFDPSNPKEDKALYRWANKVHVRTHDPVIESALLFGVGDRTKPACSTSPLARCAGEAISRT